jgi:hypothetical protein
MVTGVVTGVPSRLYVVSRAVLRLAKGANVVISDVETRHGAAL